MAIEEQQSEQSLARARELVLRYGLNATAYQILNPGIRHWFTAEGGAVVGYVPAEGVHVVAGSPVCARERLATVAAEFEADAAQHGSRVCYFAAAEPLTELFHGAEAHATILIGAQPWWEPGRWPDMLSGHASLRAQLNRAANKGVDVQEWPAARAAASPELRRCLSEWLQLRGMPPLHFLVEPQTLDRLYDRRVFVAERNRRVVGFLIISPVPRRHGWLIEQVVRSEAAPNGTSELMIDAAVRAMIEGGDRYVTLGLAPLSRRSGLPGSGGGLWLRLLLGWMRAHTHRFYNFEGLEAFKAKFRPAQWEPIHAIVNEPSFSPRMLHAAAHAFSDGSPEAHVARSLARAVRQELRWLRQRIGR